MNTGDHNLFPKNIYLKTVEHMSLSNMCPPLYTFALKSKLNIFVICYKTSANLEENTHNDSFGLVLIKKRPYKGQSDNKNSNQGMQE
jgi:hypothetical protein